MVKKGKWCLSVVLIMMLFTVPAWGYKITVKNVNTNLEGYHGGISVSVSYAGQEHYFKNSAGFEQGILPGESDTFSNTDWKTAGLCWDQVLASPATARPWRGCEIDSWSSGTPSSKWLGACRGVTVTVKRGSGCQVVIDVH